MPPRLAVLLLAFALLLPAAARAGQPATGELDAAAFVAQLDVLAGRVRATQSAADGAALARDLPATWSVRAGADRFTVPAGPVADALAIAADATSSWPAQRARAVARIVALRDEAAGLARTGTPPPAHLRRSLADVLAAPEFRGRQRYAGMMALVDRFRRWLRSWLPRVDAGQGAVVPILRYLTWAVAALAFGLLAWLTWRLLRGVSRDTARRPRPIRGVEPADARAWATRARAAAAAGEAREAVRCAYHAVLHRLDEDGAWTISEDRTPREYLRLLPLADRRQHAVSFVARLFEGTWYGGAEPGIDEARAAVRHLSEIGCDAQADPAI
ncbi:MAG: DUF4129 domain-containing protein [Vicinamibacteraceae bacterium]